MTLIYTPLQNQGKTILELLQRSVSQSNPALFLYQEKTRTPLFMAESITRILTGISGDKDLLRSRKRIKKLEDALGAIEDYETLYKLFSGYKSISKKQTDYFKNKFEKAQQKLNKKLIEKEFYQQEFQKLSTSTLNLNTKKQVKEFKHQMSKELQLCYEFFLSCEKEFTSMEDQVHEIRRKLRWLSIYAQSLDGLVILQKDNKKYPWEKQFITSAEKKSPFNKVPIHKGLSDYIYMNKKAFFALSHVIAQLGVIKDKGLNLEMLAKTEKGKHAMHQAEKQMHVNYTEADLFEQAHSLLRQYFVTYRLHDLLLLK
jgi:hypothetical protein